MRQRVHRAAFLGEWHQIKILVGYFLNILRARVFWGLLYSSVSWSQFLTLKALKVLTWPRLFWPLFTMFRWSQMFCKRVSEKWRGSARDLPWDYKCSIKCNEIVLGHSLARFHMLWLGHQKNQTTTVTTNAPRRLNPQFAHIAAPKAFTSSFFSRQIGNNKIKSLCWLKVFSRAQPPFFSKKHTFFRNEFVMLGVALIGGFGGWVPGSVLYFWEVWPEIRSVPLLLLQR